MTKDEAVGLFESVANLATALKVTRQAIYQWPDKLPTDHADRVIGAAVRTGRLQLSAKRAAA